MRFLPGWIGLRIVGAARGVMALAAIQPAAPLLAAEVRSEAKVAAFGASELLSFR